MCTCGLNVYQIAHNTRRFLQAMLVTNFITMHVIPLFHAFGLYYSKCQKYLKDTIDLK